MNQPTDYQDFFEHLPVACLVLARDGTVQQLNLHATHLLGVSGPPAEQRHFADFISPGFLPVFNAFMERVFTESAGQTCELALSATDSRPQLDAQLEASAIMGGQRCRLVLIDITRRKQAEEKLRASEALLSAGARIARLGCWEWDMSQDQFLLSEEHQRIHGSSTPKRSMSELMPLAHPDDRPAIQQAFQQAVSKGRPYEIEHRIIREDDGQIRCLKSYGVAVCDEAGVPFKLYGAAQDITDLKLAEQALRESEEKYRRLHENIIDAFASVDMQGRLIEFNQAFVNMLGYSHPELACMNFKEFTPEKWHAFEDQIIQEQILPQGYSQIYEKEYRRKNGAILPVELRALLVRDKNGQPQSMWAIVRDISERKRVEKALRESGERFRMIAQVAPVPLVVTRLSDGCYQYVNPLAAEMAGLTQSQMIGRKAADFYADQLKRAEFVEALRRDGVMRNVEMQLKGADGTPFWGLFSSVIAHLDNEEVIITALKDITERKQAEEALRESEERYRALVTASSQIVWRCDPQGNVLDVSSGWVELTAQNEEKILGKEWMVAIHPDDRAKAEQVRNQAFASENPYQTQYRVSAKDGSYRWLRGIGVPIFDAEGHVKEWVGASSDITENKRISDELRDSEAKLKTLIESVPAMLWAATADGVVNYASQAYFDFTGLPEESLESGEWVKMIHPEDFARVISSWTYYLSIGQASSIEYRVMRANGSFRWFKGIAKPVYDEEGRVIKWFGSIVDIDDQKQLEAQLVERDRQKDEFLAMLAHELQNPLAPILIAAQLLEKRGKEDVGLFDWAVGAIRHEAKHLSRLVNELLDVARVTQGKITLKKTHFNLSSVIVGIVEMNRLLLGEGKQHITYSVPQEAVMIEADQTRIEQVLGNLLSNALKYTPADGLISVSLDRQEGWALLRVRDNGVGIPKSQLGQVFGLFSQVESTLDHANGGLGVGLALAKMLIEKHGGTIQAFSEGKACGSEFRVSLPIDPEEFAIRPGMGYEIKEAAPMPAVRGRILVVDDIEFVRTAVVKLVESMGYQAVEAKDGWQALEIAKNQTFDSVLLDIGLPGMDGYETARRLRTEPGLQGLKLIAMTGYSQERDRRASLAAGFDYHLAKPLDHDLLEKILAE